MSLSFCTDKIRHKLGDNSGLNASFKFDCDKDGVVFIDAISIPHHVDNQNQEAQCTVKLSLDTLQALLTGELNPVAGFMMGKLKVEGDMSVILRLQSLL